MTPDVNVLIAASRSDHVHHRKALRQVTAALRECERGGTIQILPMVAAGFLRLATHPKIFPDPTPMEDALTFLRALLAAPGVEMPELGREWPVFVRLCADLALRGNRIPDAWIAAAVTAGGYHLVTFDRGFAGLLRSSEYTVLKP